MGLLRFGWVWYRFSASIFLLVGLRLVSGLGERCCAFLAPFAFFTAPLRFRLRLVVRLARSDRLRERVFARSCRGLPHPLRVVTSAGYSRDNSRRLRRSTLRSKAAQPLQLPLRAGSSVLVRYR